MKSMRHTAILRIISEQEIETQDDLIAKLKETSPYIEGNIFKSVENVNLDTVVCFKEKGIRHHFLDTYDDK